MVPSAVKNVNKLSGNCVTKKNTITAPANTPHLQKTHATHLPLIRQSLSKRNLSTEAKNIILSSSKRGTSMQYDTYLNKWSDFCIKSNIDASAATVEKGIEFLILLRGLVFTIYYE